MAFDGNTGHGHRHRPCCHMTTGPDASLSGSTGQDFTLASGGRAGYSHQTSTRKSSDPPLFLVLKPLCFSFYPIFPTHTYILQRLPLQAAQPLLGLQVSSAPPAVWQWAGHSTLIFKVLYSFIIINDNTLNPSLCSLSLWSPYVLCVIFNIIFFFNLWHCLY